MQKDSIQKSYLVPREPFDTDSAEDIMSEDREAPAGIVTSPMLQLLYDIAISGSKHQAAEFWAQYMREKFDDITEFTTSEFDESPQAPTNVIVKRFNPEKRTMQPILVVQCIRAGASSEKTWTHAREAGAQYIGSRHYLPVMCAAGVWGRLFAYSSGQGLLACPTFQDTFIDAGDPLYGPANAHRLRLDFMDKFLEGARLDELPTKHRTKPCYDR